MLISHLGRVSRHPLCLWFVLLASLLAPQTNAADISYYGVAKGILFTQNSAAAPVIHSGLPYAFQAVVMPPTNLIQSARVQWSLAELTLTPITTPNALSFIQRLRTQDALDATFPNGTYRILLQTVNDGAHTGNLIIAGNIYPSAPTLQSFSSVQGVNAVVPFTLRWNSFIGGTANDFIFVQIENSQGRLFATGAAPGAPNALNGTATSVVIPANVLQPGHAYTARIVFHRFSAINQADYPGVGGTGGYFSQTDFFLTTAGAGDTTPPSLVSTSPLDGATGVPVNSPVVLRFNESMSRGFALGLAGTTAPRTFEWSPDGTVLVATPVTNWPANATIIWTLNLYYTQQAFGDTNNNPLPMETAFSFTTGTSSVPPGRPVLQNEMRLANGRFQFSVSGESNRTYIVQGSTNLVQWTSLATNIAFTGQFDFLDVEPPVMPNRFYRALGK